jgi:hypothetical protein
VLCQHTDTVFALAVDAGGTLFSGSADGSVFAMSLKPGSASPSLRTIIAGESNLQIRGLVADNFGNLFIARVHVFRNHDVMMRNGRVRSVDRSPMIPLQDTVQVCKCAGDGRDARTVIRTTRVRVLSDMLSAIACDARGVLYCATGVVTAW